MQITIYTIKDCPYCKEEKEYLTAHNLPFTEKNVEEKKEHLEEMLQLSDNFAGVPFTEIIKDDGTKVGLKGFTKEEFDEALGFGSAQPVTTAPAQPAETLQNQMGEQPFDVPSAPMGNQTINNQIQQTQTDQVSFPNQPSKEQTNQAETTPQQPNPMDTLLNNLQAMSQGQTNISDMVSQTGPMQNPYTPQETEMFGKAPNTDLSQNPPPGQNQAPQGFGQQSDTVTPNQQTNTTPSIPDYPGK